METIIYFIISLVQVAAGLTALGIMAIFWIAMVQIGMTEVRKNKGEYSK